MIKKIISLIMTFTLVLVVSNPVFCKEKTHSSYIPEVFSYVASPNKLKIISEFNSVCNISKKYHSKVAINGSYFNVKTHKEVGILINDEVRNTKSFTYGRPNLFILEDKAIISDKIFEDLDKVDYALTGGQWLVKNSKSYITSNGFSSSFTKAVVNRTVIGIDSKGDIVIITITHCNLYQASRIAIKLGCVEAINLDGGSSTQYVLGNKSKINNCKKVPVSIIIK